MDILHKLRLLFWSLVLLLWGIFMYQFIFDDAGRTANPIVKKLQALLPGKQKKQKESHLLMANTPTEAQIARGQYQRSGQSASVPRQQAAQPAQSAAPQPAQQQATQFPAIAGANGLIANQSGHSPQQNTGSTDTPVWPAPPPGYYVQDTEHFLIYLQPGAVTKPEEAREIVEALRENLMKTLSVFTPARRDERVLIYIFSDRDGYTAITGRPAWSGGASSLKERSIFVLEGQDPLGVISHELTHIYFDSFFNAGTQCPLWLSEGMALMSQIEEGQSAPQWLADSITRLKTGDRLRLEELVEYEDCDGLPAEQVQLWYSECYTVVRHLREKINRADNFYAFCKNMRDGMPVNQSLYRAYGMPFNSLKHLEYAWEAYLPELEKEIAPFLNLQPHSSRGIPRLLPVSSVMSGAYQRPAVRQVQAAQPQAVAQPQAGTQPQQRPKLKLVPGIYSMPATPSQSNNIDAIPDDEN